MYGFHIKIGVSFAYILKRNIMSPIEIDFLLKFFEDRKYLIAIDIERRIIFVILKKNVNPTEVLEGYFYAAMCGLHICMARKIPIVSNESFFTYILLLESTVCVINILYYYI